MVTVGLKSLLNGGVSFIHSTRNDPVGRKEGTVTLGPN